MDAFKRRSKVFLFLFGLIFYCLFISSPALSNPDFSQQFNQFFSKLTYTSSSINQAIGVPENQLLLWEVGTQWPPEFDSEGRLVKVYFYNEATQGMHGPYTVSYEGNKVLLNNVVIGSYSGYAGPAANPNAEKSSGEVAEQETIRQTTRATVRLISSRVSSILAPKPVAGGKVVGEKQYDLDQRQTVALARPSSGMAAGDPTYRWGVWANGTMSKVDNYETKTRYNGGIFVSMLGVDYKLFESFVVGIGSGIEYTSLSTDFNDGQLFITGGSVSPYVGWAILDNLVLDVLANVAISGNYSERLSGLFSYSSRYTTYRTMIGSNVTYSYLLGNWNLGAKAGFMYANSHTPEYIERNGFGLRNRNEASNAYLGEWSFGGRVGYIFDSIEPYISLTYLWDPWMPNANLVDRDEVEATLGLNIAATDQFMISMELTNSFFRKFVSATSFMANLRYEF